MRRRGGLPRRSILSLGLRLGLGGCCVLASARFWPAAARGGYYAAHRAELLTEFREVSLGVGQWLAASGRPGLSGAVASDSQAAFERLLADLPEIGGMDNRNQPYLIQAAWLAAIRLGMGASGLGAADAGRALYDLGAEGLRQETPAALKARGAAEFTPQALERLRQWARWSALRAYPGDWVGRYVEGAGQGAQAFDYGYDMLECGAVKFLRAAGAGDAAAYFCLNDFPKSRALGTGLRRSGTLAQGAALCDFRYRRGGPVLQDWDTETARFAG